MSILYVKTEDYPFNLTIDEQRLQVSYPEIPSFSPTAEDISFFNMIGDGMVTSMRDATEIDFQNEICNSYYEHIVKQSIINEEEKNMYQIIEGSSIVVI